ncbi:MAG TPA: ankyrin repeat domain-containing protein [Casimicrobiaceae bacterium]|nr:ankyrin repeat domain-containing protein [Casimicrobiaceae bacterium]
MIVDHTRRGFLLGAALAPLAFRAGAAELLDDLTQAVANDRVDEVKRLLARGMDPNSVNADSEPMLCTAARNGSAQAAQALIAAKANVDIANRYGDTPMMLAALKGHLDIVRMLQAAGAKLDGPGWTPLIYAATGGHDDIVKFLILHGANIDAQSPNGTTALMMAIHENHPETAMLLVASGADVTRRNQDGATALDWARRAHDEDLVRELRRAASAK